VKAKGKAKGKAQGEVSQPNLMKKQDSEPSANRGDRVVDNRRAALWLLASATLFTFTNILVKTLGQTLHPFEISFFRAAVALALILPIFWRTGGLRAGMATKIPLLQLTRGVVGSLAMFLGLVSRAIYFLCPWRRLFSRKRWACAARSQPGSALSAC
jgi:hypothetical protein